ncbi:hypothetical protein BC831DRAFT_476264 [Entophlyctis helioformis]|nr:hypothetical protein BC831DRAFT_476264 [Entophlyctis helioformis]
MLLMAVRLMGLGHDLVACLKYVDVFWGRLGPVQNGDLRLLIVYPKLWTACPFQTPIHSPTPIVCRGMSAMAPTFVARSPDSSTPCSCESRYPSSWQPSAIHCDVLQSAVWHRKSNRVLHSLQLTSPMHCANSHRQRLCALKHKASRTGCSVNRRQTGGSDQAVWRR